MTWAAGLVSGILGGGASLAAGKEGSKGNKAALAQQSYMYEDQKGQLAPWRESGLGALSMLNQALGLEGWRTKEERALREFADTKPVLGDAGKVKKGEFEKLAGFGPAGWILDKQAKIVGSGDVKLPGKRAGAGGAGPVGPLKHMVSAKSKRARQQAANVAATQAKYDADMQAWEAKRAELEAASTQSLVGYDPSETARQMLSTDPGYNIRMDEAERALAARQAAGGQSQLTPGAARETTRYISDQASDEWQKYLNSLRSQAGLGQTATAQGVAAAGNYGNNTSNLMMAGGQMRGSALLNAAGAVNQGFQGGLSNYYTMDMYNRLMGGGGGRPGSAPVYYDYGRRGPDVDETYMLPE